MTRSVGLLSPIDQRALEEFTRQEPPFDDCIAGALRGCASRLDTRSNAPQRPMNGAARPPKGTSNSACRRSMS